MIKNNSLKIFCLGLNHKTTPIALREKIYLEPDKLRPLLPKLKETYGLSELLVLSTCNRLELFGTYSQTGDLTKEMITGTLKYSRETYISDGTKAHTDVHSELHEHAYLFNDLEAIRHAFNVAASLDSLIIGETQITGQFKDALSIAKSAGTLGPVMDRMGQEALATAKKVRSQTDVSRKPVSISHAAVDLARKVFSELDERHVLIIGAGEMAELAARYTLKYHPAKLTICNRTIEKAQKLVDELGFGESSSLEDLKRLLCEADVVISGTAAQGHIITKEMLEVASKQRGYRPICLVDIALPRDIEPEAQTLDEVYLFDIDDLKQLVEEHKEERSKAALEAGTLVQSGVLEFGRWLNRKDLGHVIKDYGSYVRATIEEEMTKSLSREIFKSLGTEERKYLEKMQNAIVGRLIADLSVNLKKLDHSVKDRILVDIYRMFSLKTDEQDAQ